MKNLLVIAFVLTISTLACKEIPPNVPQDAVDCLKADQSKVEALLTEFLPIVTGGSADWSIIQQRAESAGLEVGGCFLAELIQQYMGGTKAPEHMQGETAHNALKTFKDKHHVTTFKTKAGNL